MPAPGPGDICPENRIESHTLSFFQNLVSSLNFSWSYNKAKPGKRMFEFKIDPEDHTFLSRMRASGNPYGVVWT